MILFKRKQKLSDRLRDSFKSIAGEYMISQRWREHFDELFMEVDQCASQPGTLTDEGKPCLSCGNTETFESGGKKWCAGCNTIRTAN